MQILIKPNSSKKHYLLAVLKADLWKEEASGWHFYLIEIEGPKLPALKYDFDSQELKKVLKVWNEAKKANFFDNRFPMHGLISSPSGKRKFPLNDLKEIVVDV